MRLISRYLAGSIRAGAYAANLHFLSLLNVYADRFISISYIRSLAYLLYGIVIYEISARIVKTRYKPRFDMGAGGGRDHVYRATTEKMIYELLLCYGFNLAVAVLLCIGIETQTALKHIGFGVLGLIVSFFNFFGAVILACSGTSFSFKKIPEYTFSLVLMAPLVIYIFCTFYFAFWQC